MTYSVLPISRNVSRVTVPVRGAFEQRFLLTADRHWDNPQSRRDLQVAHLKQARRLKTGVLDFGDFFCAMQGKYDKRSKKDDLRPEHKVEDYLDALTDTAADFFAPYADLFILIGMGNHETKILAKHEVNLTNNLIAKLNNRCGTKVYNGGYSGWVQFEFVDDKNCQLETKTLWYIHGYGGGGPVTKGTIQHNRRAVYLPDADVIVTGHIHESWQLDVVRNRLTKHGQQYLQEQLHVQLPTYKDEYGDGWGGFHVEGGRDPRAVGAKWLVFRRERGGDPIQIDTLNAR